MGGKKNKRNRRKQKQVKVESGRIEGPTNLDEGPLLEAAGQSEPAGLESTEPPRGVAESGKAEAYGIPQGGAFGFDYLYGSPDESQNIIGETLQLLKCKEAEVNELSDMLNNAMHNWLKDMLKKVDIIKAEISGTRDLVLPTCAVLDKLKSRQGEAEDIGKLVNSILDKVEDMVKQLPAATAVIGNVIEQIDLLQKVESPMPSSKPYGEMRDEFTSSAEPHTHENTPVVSVSDPERETLIEHSLQESIVAVPSDDEPMGEVTEAGDAEGNDPDTDISEEMLTVMKTKDAEIDGFKNLLTNLMKYRVKDMMRKIDLASTEAEVTRNLAIYASDVIESLKQNPVEVDELKAVVNVLFRKVDYTTFQISAANKIVDYTMEHITRLERTDNFRKEMLKSSIYDSAVLLDSSNEAQPEVVDLENQSRADLETAIGELKVQDSTKSPRQRKSSDLNNSRSEDMADESYLAEEHLRGNSSVSSDDMENDSYSLEVSKILELISPEKRMKRDYPECPEDKGVMSQACSGYFDVQECFQDDKYFENVDDFLMELKVHQFGHDLANFRYLEKYKDLGDEKKYVTEDKCKDLTMDQEVDNEQSSDEDSSTEETGSEGVWLYKLDRQG